MTDIHTLPIHVQLLVREYGYSTYQLILGLRNIEDQAERSKRAAAIVQLMLRLQPSLREQTDIQGRLWNHLNTLLGGDVALDAPVPLRDPNQRLEKPARVPYPVRGPKLRAYGLGIEAMITKALTLEDEAEREQATIQIGRTMKFLYRQHNKENAKDVTILRHLGELSGGVLKLDAALVDSQNLFEMPNTGRPAAFIVPQPSQPREGRQRDGGNREGRDRDRQGGGNGKKKRKKGRSQEAQQPPQ